MYERKTRGVIVRVEPDFLADQSSPKDHRYIWAYTVEIENASATQVKLMARQWQIADCTGQVQKVRGKGVVGEQPILEPGETFSYTSGAPLSAPSGIMLGAYQMETADGETFDVDIPAFSLESPHERRTLN